MKNDINLKGKLNKGLVEQEVLSIWNDLHLFSKDRVYGKKSFSTIMHPTNILETMTMTEALTYTIQDIISRRKRMDKYNTYFIPTLTNSGHDIQTKLIEIAKSKNIRNKHLKFDKVAPLGWELHDLNVNSILSEMNRLGISIDLENENFDMSNRYKKVVYEAFKRLYDKKLIHSIDVISYYDTVTKMLVDPNLVEEKIIQNQNKYYIRYLLEDNTGCIDTVTTDLDSLYGDIAIAVNPEDDRYINLIGKNVKIPGSNILIPIISDESVNKKICYGTKRVTPAHDEESLEIARIQKLKYKYAYNNKLIATSECDKEYVGLDLKTLEHAILSNIQKKVSCFNIETKDGFIKINKSTGNVVKPVASRQWYLDIGTLFNNYKDFDINTFPSTIKKDLDKYYQSPNNKSVLISTQLIWGHKLPIWYKQGVSRISVDKLSSTLFKEAWYQEENTIAPWFNKALILFAYYGWPRETTLLDKYYPVDLIVSDYDNALDWLSKIVLFGLFNTGKVPFSQYIVHSIVVDKETKSKDIKLEEYLSNYGSDVLRLYLSSKIKNNVKQSILFDKNELKNVDEFLHTLWKISRQIDIGVSDVKKQKINIKEKMLTDPEKWILNKLNALVVQVNAYYDKYKFGRIYKSLVDFINNDAILFISIYEKSQKTKNNKHVLKYIILEYMKLIHPIAPFISEYIYLSFNSHKESILLDNVISNNNHSQFIEEKRYFEDLKELITTVEVIKNQYNIPLNTKLDMIIQTKQRELRSFFKRNKKLLYRYLNSKNLEIYRKFKPRKTMDTFEVTLKNLNIYISTRGVLNKRKQKTMIKQDLVELKNKINTLETEIKNIDINGRDSKKLLATKEELLKSYKFDVETLKEKLKNFQ